MKFLASVPLLASLASALPLLSTRQDPVAYPPTSISKAFRLRVNVTGQDLDPPINHLAVVPFRISPGNYALSLNVADPSAPGAVFWQNNTVPDPTSPPFGLRYTINTDSGLQYALGASSSNTDDVHVRNAGLVAGNGEVGWDVAPDGFPAPQLRPTLPSETQGTLVVCKNVAAPSRPELAVSIVQATRFEEGGLNARVPAGCTRVTLLAECARFGDLPATAEYTRDFAIDSRCYEDVAAIDWSAFSPVARKH